MSRISVFTGHFGSGKTEISVNYAKKLARQGKKVAIVDIDIVNPYFCSRNLKKEFDELGIKVIASDPNLMNAELMVVPSEVMAVFNDKSYEVVMDIGGDDQGATVLGQYNKYFMEEDYDMYFVINNNRPLTSTTEDTTEYIKSIERASRLKVNYLISNSNLSYDTTVEHILSGDKLVKELSEEINVPYMYVVCDKKFVNDIQGKVHAEILPVDIYMKPPWR